MSLWRRSWMTAEVRDGDGAVGTASGPDRVEQSGLAPGLANLRDPEAFERRIFIKQNAAWLLEQELKKIDPADEIAIGTATDPYQPIERRARVTRSILEVFARRAGHRIGIVTKSKLIERDIDLLQEISQRNALVVHLTITTAGCGAGAEAGAACSAARSAVWDGAAAAGGRALRRGSSARRCCPELPILPVRSTRWRGRQRLWGRASSPLSRCF